jgi:hypothetical protein
MGKTRIYNSAFKEAGRDDVVKWDILHVQDGSRVMVIFESSSSPWRQGVWLKTDEGLLINGIVCKSVELWIDSAPNEVIIECRTSDGALSVYNIWDRGKGRESQAWTSGMLVDELDKGRRYHCNDIGLETGFDKLIFQIKFLE